MSLELAQQALAAVPAGNEAMVRVLGEHSATLRFARSRPTQATSVEDETIEISVIRDGHMGRGDTNRSDPESLAQCAAAAVAAAEAAARTHGPGSYPGLPSPAQARTHDGWDAATARVEPEGGGAALTTAFEIAAAQGLEAHGVWTAAESRIAIASTRGIAVTDRTTDAFMKVTCFAPNGRSGFATGTAVGAAGLDAAAIAVDAARKASLAGEPVSLPPGDYPVVLEAEAVGEVLTWIGRLAFNGLAYAEGRSAVEGRLGTRVAAASINLSDSPRHPRTLPRAYDGEGVPKAPLPLIQDGVAHRIVHDTRSAAAAGGGAASTGHARPAVGDERGPEPTNLVLIGGGAADTAALVSKIERGVFVTRLWYTNPVRPKQTLVTGMTRDGTFLIEDGVIAHPLDDMRMTDSLLGLLDRVQDLGARPRLVTEGEFYGRRFAHGVVCPAVRLSHMRFTA